jgi:hypothetical protein
MLMVVEYSNAQTKQIVQKPLVWDDDVLVISDFSDIKLDIDFRLYLLKE